MERRAYFLPKELIEGLKVLKARDGASEGESIRRALESYLREKKVLRKSKR